MVFKPGNMFRIHGYNVNRVLYLFKDPMRLAQTTGAVLLDISNFRYSNPEQPTYVLKFLVINNLQTVEITIDSASPVGENPEKWFVLDVV